MYIRRRGWGMKDEGWTHYLSLTFLSTSPSPISQSTMVSQKRTISTLSICLLKKQSIYTNTHVLTLVASRDWWASRKVVSVTRRWGQALTALAKPAAPSRLKTSRSPSGGAGSWLPLFSVRFSSSGITGAVREGGGGWPAMAGTVGVILAERGGERWNYEDLTMHKASEQHGARECHYSISH